MKVSKMKYQTMLSDYLNYLKKKKIFYKKKRKKNSIREHNRKII